MENTYFCMGILGMDPDIKYTPAGKPYCNFSLAVRRNAKGASGEWITDWIKFAAFNKNAELINAQAQKGSVLFVVGELQANRWKDKNGNMHENMKVVVSRVWVLTNYRIDNYEKIEDANIEPIMPKNKQTQTNGGFLEDVDDFASMIGNDAFPFF